MNHPSREPTLEEVTVTHVRGSSLGGLFREIDGLPKADRDDLLASLSPAARTTFRESPGPFQWIETPCINELVTAFEDRFGPDSVDRRVGHTVRQQMTVIHGWMMRLLTPETLFHQAPILYRFNLRGGFARTEKLQPGHAVLVVGSAGLYPSWYVRVFPGWLEGALGMVGARSPAVRHRPPASGFLHRYEASWSE